MNYYKVVTTSIVQSNSVYDAMQIAVGNTEGVAGKLVTRWADHPGEPISDDQGLGWVEFTNELSAAVSTTEELYTNLEGHSPRVRFSPAAAAVIKRLNEESADEAG